MCHPAWQCVCDNVSCCVTMCLWWCTYNNRVRQARPLQRVTTELYIAKTSANLMFRGNCLWFLESTVDRCWMHHVSNHTRGSQVRYATDVLMDTLCTIMYSCTFLCMRLMSCTAPNTMIVRSWSCDCDRVIVHCSYHHDRVIVIVWSCTAPNTMIKLVNIAIFKRDSSCFLLLDQCYLIADSHPLCH